MVLMRTFGTTFFLAMAVPRYGWNSAELGQELTSFQADSVFSGISTFGRLPYSPCLNTHASYDIAFIGRYWCSELERIN